MLASTLLATLFATLALACPEHDFHARHLQKRAEETNMTWAYEASYDWGRLSPDYVLCQDGTQQAPIPLRLDQGLSLRHVPGMMTGYDRNVSGSFYNWGYGPAMTLTHAQGEFTTLPHFTFEEENGQNETVYMSGWHIHAPADHSVQGDRSKAELHFVHVTADGHPRAVLAFRIDPGSHDSQFFRQMPDLISFRETSKRVDTAINLDLAMLEAERFSEFWTYRWVTWHIGLPGANSFVS
jgi:carbonic anhydrase